MLHLQRGGGQSQLVRNSQSELASQNQGPKFSLRFMGVHSFLFDCKKECKKNIHPSKQVYHVRGALVPHSRRHNTHLRQGSRHEVSLSCVKLLYCNCILTSICCRNWFHPLGSYLGIKCSVHKKPPTNELLEAELNKMAKDKLHVLNYKSLSEQMDMSERQIQVWFRNRKLYGQFQIDV